MKNVLRIVSHCDAETIIVVSLSSLDLSQLEAVIVKYMASLKKMRQNPDMRFRKIKWQLCVSVSILRYGIKFECNVRKYSNIQGQFE